jgi:hypothetical protein
MKVFAIKSGLDEVIVFNSINDFNQKESWIDNKWSRVLTSKDLRNQFPLKEANEKPLMNSTEIISTEDELNANKLLNNYFMVNVA